MVESYRQKLFLLAYVFGANLSEKEKGRIWTENYIINIDFIAPL